MTRAIFRTHGDLADFAKDLTQLVNDAVHEHRILTGLERNETEARGYPTSSMRAGSPSTTVDDEGVPMPALSDPTGEAAIRPHLGNEAARRRNQLEAALVATRRQLLAAIDQARPITHPPVPSPTLTDELWCEHHARHGMTEPRGTEKEVGKHSRLCGWCHAFNRTHGQLPPKALLEHKAAGERITSRALSEAGIR